MLSFYIFILELLVKLYSSISLDIISLHTVTQSTRYNKQLYRFYITAPRFVLDYQTILSVDNMHLSISLYLFKIYNFL